MELAFLAWAQDWAAGGHAPSSALFPLVGRVAAALALAAWIALFVRAWLRRGRYRAVSALSEADRAELARRIHEAERRTEGEIVLVVLERSDRYPSAPWLAALLFLLVGTALAAPWLPWDAPLSLVLCQVGLGAIGFGTAHALPGLRRLFISPTRMVEMAEEQALIEFARHGLERTANRTGVLIFVSLLEQRVIVLGDEGIDARVEAAQWEQTAEAILAGARGGSLARGLTEGIARTAEVLTTHFPWTLGDRDELPDHVEVRVE